MDKVHFLKFFLPTGRISLQHFCSELSQKEAVVLQLSPMCGICISWRTIYKADLSFLFLYQVSLENFNKTTVVCSRKEGRVAGVEAMGIWATSFCKLFVPSRPAEIWSHICDFHLMMKCCCVCPTLWQGGSDNTQSMMGNSGCKVTWLPMVKHSVSTTYQ